jgi:ABC-type cobalamin transport system ATPase subunit
VKYHVWQACLPLAQQVAWRAQKALLLGQSLLVVLSNADLWRTESTGTGLLLLSRSVWLESARHIKQPLHDNAVARYCNGS